ncbi:MAG: hypothetical protein K1X94_05480 [Sandaracinaceae bacterium]|nr:hypothetical protein [Sandaracinaceae bacterium]
MSRVIEQVIAEHPGGSLEDFASALVRGLADVHMADPELHQLVTALVPEGPAGFRAALLETFEGVIAPNDEVGRRRLFVLPHLVESLVHGLTQRPDFISRESAKDEAVRTVRLYLAPA